MKPTFFGIFSHKIGSFKQKIRTTIFKLRGLKILKGSTLGKITCDWPHRLIIGENCDIQDMVDFRIWHPYDANNFIKLGDKVFIGHGCEFASTRKIIIGNNCLIASGCTFIDVGHEYAKSSNINEQPLTPGEIIIEDDVWIAMSCSILKGVTIGKGTVIGAGSVVNKSIPPYEVWAGVPARFIKKRE
jgi:acetyltransferase-like isoleucine patch superfamily enzyme